MTGTPFEQFLIFNLFSYLSKSYTQHYICENSNVNVGVSYTEPSTKKTGSNKIFRKIENSFSSSEENNLPIKKPREAISPDDTPLNAMIWAQSSRNSQLSDSEIMNFLPRKIFGFLFNFIRINKKLSGPYIYRLSIDTISLL